MINSSTTTLRKLKEFFESHLGLHSWNGVEIKHVGRTEDEEYEYVAIEFPRNGKRFRLEAIPPQDDVENISPLGSLLLRGENAETISGDLSQETFGRIHQALLAA